MAAPTLPTTKPPIWASLLNYSIGPDSGGPTKFDSTSIAPNGHVPGKDFASTGPEQNDWQNKASFIVNFLFDSIATVGSQGGDDDRRVMITDDDGFIDLTGIKLHGSSGVVEPTIKILGSVSGAACVDITANQNDDAGLFVRNGWNSFDGYLVEIVDTFGKAAGLNIELDDPSFTGLRVIIENTAEDGDGVAIIAQGGRGDGSKNGGEAIIAIGGKEDLGGFPFGGVGLLAMSTDVETPAIDAIGTNDNDVPVIHAFQSGAGNAIQGTAVDGMAGRFESLGAGVPLVLVPRDSEPTGVNDESGQIWPQNNAGQGDQTDLRVQLGPSSVSDRRWMVSYQDQYVRALGFFPAAVTENGTGTKVVGNFSFLGGSIPQETNIFVLITLTFTMTRLINSVDGDDSFLATIQVHDVVGGANMINAGVSAPSHYTENGSPAPGTAITWGDRKMANCEQKIVLRDLYTLPNTGAGDFEIRFSATADAGTLQLSNVICTIESAF